MPTTEEQLTQIIAGQQALMDLLQGQAGDWENRVATVESVAATFVLPLNSFDAVNDIYFSPGGDDENDGKTPATAVASWTRVAALMRATLENRIYLLGDIVLDTFVAMYRAAGHVYVQGVDAAGNSAKRTVRIVDDPGGDRPGGMWARSFVFLSFTDIDFVNEAAAGLTYAAFDFSGPFSVWMLGCSIANTDAAKLFGSLRGANGHFSLSGTTIDASAQGHVLQYVNAGGDPNDRNGFSSNVHSF